MRETFALAAVLLGACSLPPDAAPVDAPADVAIDAPPVPGGPHHGYVVSRLLVPANATEAAQLGLDIDDRPNDANGGIDNQLAGAGLAVMSRGRERSRRGATAA